MSTLKIGGYMKYILKGNKPCRKRCLEPNSITINGGSYRMITEEEHDPYDHISFNEAFGKTTSVEEEFERFEVRDEEMGH